MKGYALLVGVTEVDTSYYSGQLSLKSVEKDLEIMQDIIDSTGCYNRVDILRNDQATTNNFLCSLNHYSNLSKTEEGYLFIFFSGHGASFPYTSDTNKEYLCFYDKMLLENEMRKYLCDIELNFKIFFIINSCYSAGVVEKMNLFVNGTVFQNLWNLTTPTTISHLKGFKKDLQDINTGVDLEAKSTVLQRIDEQIRNWGIIKLTYNRYYEKYSAELSLFKEDFTNYRTEICFLSSCKKDQRTELGPLFVDPTYFVNIIKVLWNQNKDRGITYSKFYDLLKKNMKQHIEPDFQIWPKQKADTFFTYSKPFYFGIIQNENSLKTENMIEEIILCEKGEGKQVSATLSSGLQIFQAISSTTYDLEKESDHIYVKPLVELLGDDLIDVQFLGVINVEIHDYNGFPHFIKKMYSHNDEPDGAIQNGLVILLDSAGTIRSKKRTAGKVTNVMGD